MQSTNQEAARGGRRVRGGNFGRTGTPSQTSTTQTAAVAVRKFDNYCEEQSLCSFQNLTEANVEGEGIIEGIICDWGHYLAENPLYYGEKLVLASTHGSYFQHVYKSFQRKFPRHPDCSSDRWFKELKKGLENRIGALKILGESVEADNGDGKALPIYRKTRHELMVGRNDTLPDLKSIQLSLIASNEADKYQKRCEINTTWAADGRGGSQDFFLTVIGILMINYSVLYAHGAN